MVMAKVHMNRYVSKFLLTFIFALLQCVTPLVHAHVSGIQSGILPPSLAVHYHLEKDDGLKSADTFEENESPAITVPHEFQRNNQSAIPQPWQNGIIDLPNFTIIKLQSTLVQSVVTSFPYCKPHPQAPPTLT
jgi:hypothetical protein